MTHSQIAEVLIAASDQLRHTGALAHFFTDCTYGGWVNATADKHGTACVACEVNMVAETIEQAEEIKE